MESIKSPAEDVIPFLLPRKDKLNPVVIKRLKMDLLKKSTSHNAIVLVFAGVVPLTIIFAAVILFIIVLAVAEVLVVEVAVSLYLMI